MLQTKAVEVVSTNLLRVKKNSSCSKSCSNLPALPGANGEQSKPIILIYTIYLYSWCKRNMVCGTKLFGGTYEMPNDPKLRPIQNVR